jgi:hypothetical protein
MANQYVILAAKIKSRHATTAHRHLGNSTCDQKKKRKSVTGSREFCRDTK